MSSIQRTCIADDCIKVVQRTMLCPKHTKEFDDQNNIGRKIPLCSIENCNKPAHGKGWCRSHYMMHWRYGDVNHEPKQYHRMVGTPEYKTWLNIRYRCFYEKDIAYARYGGRGVTVCDGWRNSFESFYIDMGKRPSSGHSIDRRDSDGHYSCGKCKQCTANAWPMNCRWATTEVQNWNKKKTKRNTSGYIGVCWGKWGWRAAIGVKEDGKSKYYSLGAFQDIEEAALEYDKAAIFFRGDEAVTNIL